MQRDADAAVPKRWNIARRCIHLLWGHPRDFDVSRHSAGMLGIRNSAYRLVVFRAPVRVIDRDRNCDVGPQGLESIQQVLRA